MSDYEWLSSGYGWLCVVMSGLGVFMGGYGWLLLESTRVVRVVTRVHSNVVISGQNEWLRVVMSGYEQFRVVIEWLGVVTSGYEWLRVVIGCIMSGY